MDCGGPSRLDAMWSDDSRYVALNNNVDGFWRLHVVYLNGQVPQYIGSSGLSPFENPSLISGNGESIQELEVKALGWSDNRSLKTVIFVRSYSDQGPYDIDAGAHVNFHLDGLECGVTQENSDFRWEFIADL